MSHMLDKWIINYIMHDLVFGSQIPVTHIGLLVIPQNENDCFLYFICDAIMHFVVMDSLRIPTLYIHIWFLRNIPADIDLLFPKITAAAVRFDPRLIHHLSARRQNLTHCLILFRSNSNPHREGGIVSRTYSGNFHQRSPSQLEARACRYLPSNHQICVFTNAGI